jgi:hypothetical protein
VKRVSEEDSLESLPTFKPTLIHLSQPKIDGLGIEYPTVMTIQGSQLMNGDRHANLLKTRIETPAKIVATVC